MRHPAKRFQWRCNREASFLGSEHPPLAAERQPLATERSLLVPEEPLLARERGPLDTEESLLASEAQPLAAEECLLDTEECLLAVEAWQLGVESSLLAGETRWTDPEGEPREPEEDLLRNEVPCLAFAGTTLHLAARRLARTHPLLRSQVSCLRPDRR